MITFRVVKEQHGWAIRTSGGMTTPFWSRDAAIREACRLASDVRSHAECTEVVVEGLDPAESLQEIKGASLARFGALLPEHHLDMR